MTDNPSGINPTEFKVLINPDPIEAKIGSILLPDDKITKEEYAQTKGRIVAVSPHAFSYEDAAAWERAKAQKPKPGDIAIYAKYAGMRLKGRDGKDYLIVNDKDICATYEE